MAGGADGAGADGAGQVADAQGDQRSLLDSAATQLAALITVIAATVYAFGVLTLGLRLFNDELSWTPVLGQLPQQFLLSIGFGQLLIPSMLVATAGFLLWRWVGYPMRIGPVALNRFWGWVASSIVLGVAVVLPGWLLTTFGRTPRGAVPTFGAIASISVLVMGASTWLLWRLQPYLADPGDADRGARRWRALAAIGLITLAVLPGVGTLAASVPMPLVTICGARYSMRGELIGSSNGIIYVAQFRPEGAGSQPRIAEVPQSESLLELVGTLSDCSGVKGAVAPPAIQR